MPRLKHVSTGAIVSVSDDKAARLGSEWEPVGPEPKKEPAKRAASKK